MRRRTTSFSLALGFCSAAAVRGFQVRPASVVLPSSRLSEGTLASNRVSSPSILSSLSASSQSMAADTTTTDRYRFLSDDENGGIRKVVDSYDVFLLDMWGVMHDGIRPYEGVPEVVQRLQEAGKKLIILSNSSKRKTNSVKMLKKLGFADDAFDEIITSGEVAHHLLEYLSNGNEAAASSWVPKNLPPCLESIRTKSTTAGSQQRLSAFCFGSGDGDQEYLESCGWTLADSIGSADIIVARGTFVVQSATELASKTEDEASYWKAYQTALEQAAKAPNPVPMVVCNPDKVRPDAAKSPMPGTIGVAYQELLQKEHGTAALDDLVFSLGKPFPSVYEIALSSLDNTNVDKSRVCMVGDALETDVTGATTTGIDSVWVIRDGIHNQAIEEATSNSDSNSSKDGCEAVLQTFNEASESTYARGRKVAPTVVVSHFRW